MKDYYNNKAWNWEKLALAGALLVIGSPQLDKIVENIKNQCLKKINLLVLIKEVNEMREKLTNTQETQENILSLTKNLLARSS